MLTLALALLSLAPPPPGPDCTAAFGADGEPPATVAGARAALEAVADEPECLGAVVEWLQDGRGVPVVTADSALVVWAGPAETVAVAGDWTGWAPVSLGRHADTVLWTLAVPVPPGARLDYKLVVDGEWMVDPLNPHEQWGGAGPNSELRAADWTPDPLTARDPAVPAGTLSAPDTLQAEGFGGPVVVRIYTPAGAPAGPLPVVYVTDGHEYADDRLGAMVTVLDNAIAGGRMAPAAAVFVDPRWDGVNRRAEHYVQNPAFAAFVARTVVPYAEARLADAGGARADRDGRVLLGTSLGGLFAAYAAAEHPDVWGRLAIQSPAFWVSEPNDRFAWLGPTVYDRVAALPARSLRVYLSTGTVNDVVDGARRMLAVLQARDHALVYAEVPEGHSWGAWRAQLGAALGTLVPPR